MTIDWWHVLPHTLTGFSTIPSIKLHSAILQETQKSENHPLNHLAECIPEMSQYRNKFMCHPVL